jgi:NCS1 family nucleobase:cation symporter-1
LVAVIFAASILLAIVGAGNFMTNYENYLLLILYLFIPWTAINLTDYYFVKKGSYDIDAFYDPHGVYGHDPAAHIVRGVSLPAMAAYVVGFCVQLPFMSTTIYQGFMVPHLGGADISWIIGLIVSAGLYYYLVRGTVRRTAAQPASSPVVN